MCACVCGGGGGVKSVQHQNKGGRQARLICPSVVGMRRSEGLRPSVTQPPVHGPHLVNRRRHAAGTGATGTGCDWPARGKVPAL